MHEFLQSLIGPACVVAFLVLAGFAFEGWERLKKMAARTAQPGGDHFILDRDVPPRKR